MLSELVGFQIRFRTVTIEKAQHKKEETEFLQVFWNDIRESKVVFFYARIQN